MSRSANAILAKSSGTAIYSGLAGIIDFAVFCVVPQHNILKSKRCQYHNIRYPATQVDTDKLYFRFNSCPITVNCTIVESLS